MKNIVITGGNSGIGLETARALYADGHSVIIGSRNEQKSIAAIRDIQQSRPSSTGTIKYFQLDLTKKDSIEKFAQLVKQQFTHIDILINNAGLIREER
jgi:NAD(P)-dependent dehydrogenase (short-subunit alcohol dehydrogenase family)